MKAKRAKAKNRPQELPDLGPTRGKADERYYEEALTLLYDEHKLDHVPSHRRRQGLSQRATWFAPDGMPKWQAVLVANGRMCGSKLKGRQGFCRQRPIPGQFEARKILPHRCRQHGGNKMRGNTGGLGRPTEHGLASSKRAVPKKTAEELYRDAFADADRELFDAIAVNDEELASLRREIAVTKVQFARALRFLREQDELVERGVEPEDMPKPYAFTRRSTTKESETGPNGDRTRLKVERVTKLTDFRGHADRYRVDLARLLEAQARLIGDEPATPGEYAERVRQMMAELDQAHKAAEGDEEVDAR